MNAPRFIGYVPDWMTPPTAADQRSIAKVEARLFAELQERETSAPGPARLPRDHRDELPHFAGVFEPDWDPHLEEPSFADRVWGFLAWGTIGSLVLCILLFAGVQIARAFLGAP